MNHTRAACGHAVIAVGAPDSPARRQCELSVCPACYELAAADSTATRMEAAQREQSVVDAMQAAVVAFTHDDE